MTVRRGRRGHGRLAACAIATLAALASGCTLQLSDLNFRVDDRLHFTAPDDRELVHLPVTISWTIRDFTVAAPGSQPPSRDAGYFAVFVDRAPVRPRQTLDAVASGDPACQADPRCPGPAYLAAHDVYPTTQMSVTLRHVDDLTGTNDKTQLHVATVVLMDTAGHRIGESFWHISFKLKKRSFS